MMTSPRVLRRWIFCLIGTALLHAVVIISGSGSSCRPEEACHPPSVELANLSFPLRRLNVSSTCGADGSSAYCMPEYTVSCSNDTAVWCTGEYTTENMLDWTPDDVNPHYPTYWQSENSITTEDAQPTPQYVQVRSTNSSHCCRH